MPVAHYLPELPAWADDVTARHLAHHTAGLPAAGEIESSEDDWTDAFAMAALHRLPQTVSVPGTAFRYSNLGYVLLAHVVARAAECPFPRFVEAQLFEPLGLKGLGFAASDISVFPQADLLGSSKPLTMGDGGLWATAGAFSRWLHHQNGDTLGVAGIVTAPAKLIGGAIVDYGWGLGLRRKDGNALFFHGGQWAGCTAIAVRSPSTGIAIAALSSGASMDDLSPLVESVMDQHVRPAWVPYPH